LVRTTGKGNKNKKKEMAGAGMKLDRTDHAGRGQTRMARKGRTQTKNGRKKHRQEKECEQQKGRAQDREGLRKGFKSDAKEEKTSPMSRAQWWLGPLLVRTSNSAVAPPPYSPEPAPPAAPRCAPSSLRRYTFRRGRVLLKGDYSLHCTACGKEENKKGMGAR
jgi:hypothetical protein